MNFVAIFLIALMAGLINGWGDFATDGRPGSGAFGFCLAFFGTWVAAIFLGSF